MISAVDTVEWGTGEQSGERPGRLRTASLAVTGRGAAAALGVLGFAVLIAAELLPWGRLNLTAPDTGGFGQRGGPDPDTLSRLSSIGLDRLDIGSTLTYRIGSLVLLAVVGATIFGRPAQRRAAFGMGLGVLAAQILIVVSMVHSLNSVDPLGATGLGALALGGDLTQASSSVESGTFCAFARAGPAAGHPAAGGRAGAGPAAAGRRHRRARRGAGRRRADGADGRAGGTAGRVVLQPA
jgi:hypothetical protein